MLWYEFKGTGTISSGVCSINTLSITHAGYLRQFIIKCNTSTTILDFALVDPDGFTVFPTDDMIYNTIEGGCCLRNCNIPMRGVYTLKITNASYDDGFSYKLSIEEA